MNPHFDMEEDESSYYLVGELPGASAQDISIEASGHDDRTLTISGSMSRTLHPGKQTWIGPGVVDGVQRGVGGTNVPVEILGNGNGYPDQDLHEGDTAEVKEKEDVNTKKSTKVGGRRVLLSERLTGDFHRTFNFPSSIVEEGVKASTENGLLFLVVPKKVASLNENAKKKIAVGSGKPHDFYIGPMMVGPTVI